MLPGLIGACDDSVGRRVERGPPRQTATPQRPDDAGIKVDEANADDSSGLRVGRDSRKARGYGSGITERRRVLEPTGGDPRSCDPYPRDGLRVAGNSHASARVLGRKGTLIAA